MPDSCHEEKERGLAQAGKVEIGRHLFGRQFACVGEGLVAGGEDEVLQELGIVGGNDGGVDGQGLDLAGTVGDDSDFSRGVTGFGGLGGEVGLCLLQLLCLLHEFGDIHDLRMSWLVLERELLVLELAFEDIDRVLNEGVFVEVVGGRRSLRRGGGFGLF